MQGLQFADPHTDWETHMLRLKARMTPRALQGWLQTRLLLAYTCVTVIPPTLNAHTRRKHSSSCQPMHHPDDCGLIRVFISQLACRCIESKLWPEFDWVVHRHTPILSTLCLGSHNVLASAVVIGFFSLLHVLYMAGSSTAQPPKRNTATHLGHGVVYIEHLMLLH